MYLMLKGENPTYMISLQRFNFGLYSAIYRSISFNLCMMIGAIKLYILIPV